MISATIDDSLSVVGRAYWFSRVQCEQAQAVLVIRAGKRRDVYALQELPEPVPGSREFLLLKVTGERQEFGPYCVTVRLVPQTRPGECSCTGWGRWGACKHLAALEDLVKEQNLQPLS